MNEKLFPTYLRPRNIKRYRHIVNVLARHGFGSVLEYLNVSQRLSLPRRLLRQEPGERIPPAVHFRLALEELGPTFIKIGQILSTRPDLLPPAYITELTKLQDDAPPVAWDSMHAILVQELGENPEQFFSSIDHEPLAAASLAQVHGACLMDGREVVIKIQRPGIQDTIDIDMEILHDLAALAERTSLGKLFNPIDMVEDFAYTLDNELDYRREGRNADTFRNNFKHESHLYVPEVHWSLSTRHVLVMERISGIKVDDIASIDAAGYDRKKLADIFVRMIIKEILEDGFFHGDPHPGNLVVMKGGVLGAMDFGLVGQLRPVDRQNLVRMYLSTVNMNAAELADHLLRIGAVKTDQPLDRKALTRDLDRLLMKYQGLPLEDLKMQEIMSEINPIALEHHLQMPSDFWLLGKTITIMEGIGLTLDPELDLHAAAQQYTQKMVWQLLLPQKNLGQSLVQQSADWNDLIRALPRTSGRLLEKAERGDLFQIGFKDTDRIINGLSRLTTRLALALVAAALLISLAMLIPLTAAGSVVQWIVIAGFLGAAGLGVWLLISMQRSL